jgi:hypothetical protein
MRSSSRRATRRKRLNRKTRKSILSSIEKCHPGNTRKEKCLPIKLAETPECKPEDEHCRLDHTSIPDEEKRELRKQYLRPRYPSEWKNDPDMWLSNYDIEAVMKQYVDAHKDFKFLGVLPIDFSAPDPYNKATVQCLHPEICNLNLRAEYERGIRQIGMVFNLDPHFKGGSHWVALFICIKNINKPWAAYFDSYGYETPKLIARFMKSLKLQAKNIKLMYNARRFQYSATECGMYSLFFLIMMLKGISFKNFCHHPVPDGTMLKLRHILFTS